MKLSVCITTYNHEKYISQAIDSVLIQQSHFEYEIIIGEDDSEDRTREIVKSYKSRYPERIRLFLNNRKNVIYINGQPTGRWNFVNNLKHARGQYIALLDGDDYWIDRFKLQKQLDLMDRNPQIAFCYHNAKHLHDDGGLAPPWSTESFRKPIASFADMLFPVAIPTSSVLFRREALIPLPEWYFELPMGDWPLWILLAQYGDVAYMESTMSVYRVHASGVSSKWDPIGYHLGRIAMFQHVNEDTDYRYDDIIRNRLSIYYLQLSIACANRGSLEKARYYLKLSLLTKPINRERGLINLLTIFSRLYVHPLYRLLKFCQGSLVGVRPSSTPQHISEN